MAKIHKLFNKFTNRKKRWESDCSVIEEIVGCYRSSDSDESRKEAVKWLFRTMEDKDTKTIARDKILAELRLLREVLSDKKRKRLEKHERKLKKKDKRALLPRKKASVVEKHARRTEQKEHKKRKRTESFCATCTS